MNNSNNNEQIGFFVVLAVFWIIESDPFGCSTLEHVKMFAHENDKPNSTIDN